MICRMWHGRTPRAKADACARLLEQRAASDCRAAPGNLDASVLRRDAGDVTHFMTVTHWESEASVRAFAGDDVLAARYDPEDADHLLEREPCVQHFQVTAVLRNG